MTETIETTDFVLRQKSPKDPLEIWVDLLLTDVVELSDQNIFKGYIKSNSLYVQTGDDFVRQIGIDEKAQKILKSRGGILVFSGPSGIVAQGNLVLQENVNKN